MKLGLLVVLAVAVLVPSLSEGRIISKCELKNTLRKVIPEMSEYSLDQAVCAVNIASGLDTGVFIVDGKRTTTTVMSSTPTAEQLNDGETKEDERWKEIITSSPFFSSWSDGFYGLFLLSDRYFCDSGNRSSRNLCNTSCSAFTDDDITDDVECLVKGQFYWGFEIRTPIWCRDPETLTEC